jgi:hypothetical protein
MENVFEIVETSSSEESEDEKVDRIVQPTKFLNRFPMEEYERNRNKLFTKNIIRKKIVIDSQSYYFGPLMGVHEFSDTEYARRQALGQNFNTSDYKVQFDIKRDAALTGYPSTLVTANYGIFNNVIGFRLSKAMVRVPTYNVNKTNNVIKYIEGFGDGYTLGSTVHSITINPGVYNAHELAAVFQKYHGVNTGELDDSENPVTYSVFTNTHFCNYSDSNVGSGTYDASEGTFTRDVNTFTCKFKERDANDLFKGDNGSGGVDRVNLTDYYRGMAFEITGPTDTDITIIWNNDAVTRAAAKLFGFLPRTADKTSTGYTQENTKCMFSDKIPDLSTQFVDLVVPEIPSIACKKNSNGKDIIERIQLEAGHGEYVYYEPDKEESKIQNYFSPIRLSKIQIQLFAWNNELFDSQNSDNSFEFEITMVKDKRLLA